jgi:hypothetical protein
MHIVLVIIFAFVGVVGCVQRSELIPAPEVSTPTEAPKVATAEVAGVRVLVTPDKWQDQPRRLPYIQDLHVAVENQSGIPLRLRYSEFELVSATGFTASPLPPYQIRQTAIEPVLHPAFYSHRFRVAPHHVQHFPTLGPWPSRFDFDEGFYRHQYGLWEPHLPTRQMLEVAIPEGVIDDGGQVSGFLYFQELDPDMARVTFTMELINANTGESFGVIRIPFILSEA